MSNNGQSINKIHINNTTKMTLSDRFTAFSAQPKIVPRTSRREVDSPVSRAASIANRRLLKQLAQKHTREAALKLKRRSMKTRPQTVAYNRINKGFPLKRGSIKALRLGPSGRLMKANSITNVATMEADILGRAPRRSNSVSRVSERIGRIRPDAAIGTRRVGGRQIWRTNSQKNFENPIQSRMRSRSRSRTRRVPPQISPRSSQQQGSIGNRLARGRSNSRSRPLYRSQSRLSRIDRTNRVNEVEPLPVKSRLGRRPVPVRTRSTSRRGRRPVREGVTTGRIQKRRNSVKAVTTRGVSLAGGVQSRIGRGRGRANPQKQALRPNQRLNTLLTKSRNNLAPRGGGRARSRSRTNNIAPRTTNGTARSNSVNRQRGGIQRNARGRGVARGNGRRGRSQQRGGENGSTTQRNGGSQPQRRGRSRSRGGRGNNRGGGRQLGNDKTDVKKEDLDKELDQYMSSTKTSDGLFS